MLCELGQKLKDDLADSSLRFSDYPEVGVKHVSGPARLKAENLHIEQQEALGAFTRHVEACPVCSEERS